MVNYLLLKKIVFVLLINLEEMESILLILIIILEMESWILSLNGILFNVLMIWKTKKNMVFSEHKHFLKMLAGQCLQAGNFYIEIPCTLRSNNRLSFKLTEFLLSHWFDFLFDGMPAEWSGLWSSSTAWCGEQFGITAKK